MKKQQIGALVLALTMLSSVAFAGCKKKETTSSSAAQETTAGVPTIKEDMGGDAVLYEARGEKVQLTVEDVENADGKVLHCANRMETWNGVNFPCDFFAGNTVKIKTAVKCENGMVTISLQFDTLGSPTYSNLFQITGCKDGFVVGEGTIPIPAEATNVMVYVEGPDTSDIWIDYMYINVEGEYKDPSNVAPVELVETDSYESLKDLYKDDFLVGCCVPDSLVTNDFDEPRKLLVKEFNSITCENEMKPENILDAQTTLSDPAKYDECPAMNFDKCKPILDFAKENGMQMRGHTLVWHSQTPDWFFYEGYDTKGNLASRELMLKRMENYIKGVFDYIGSNYPGLFYAFDVANECVDDSYKLRESYWTKTIGDDFLEYAFAYARQYAPKEIKLFYNDYNEYYPKKQDKIIEVLKPIAEAGNIDGMGLQSHITISDAPVEKYATALKKYADELGVVIHVTELDVNAPKSNADYEQGVYYQALFEKLLELKKEGYQIESVTIWGLTDAGSWRREQTPVLFRGDLSTKPAFQGVVNAKKGGTLEKPADFVEPPKEGDPFKEDYEDGKIGGGPRSAVTLKVVDTDANGGSKCLCVSGAAETWDGYTIDATRFMGKKIKYTFAVKSNSDVVSFSADISDLWPHIEEVDTSSHDWVVVSGELDMTTTSWNCAAGPAEVPGDMTSLILYWETFDNTEDFYLDDVCIEIVG